MKLFKTLHYLYERFFAVHCPSRAASLAYATLLSLVPLTLISFTVLSWVPALHGIGQGVQDFIVRNFVADSATQITHQLARFIQQLAGLKTTNLIFLTVVCVLLIYNMVGAFNEIWQVKMQRHFALSFIIYLLILLLLPILFSGLLFLTSYVASLPLLAQLKSVAYIAKPFVLLLPYVSAFIVFTLFNWLLPSCKVKFWQAAVAGAMTAVLFEMAKHGFVLYVRFVPTYRIIYGALATIPIFLIWLYVSWLIILIGALICHLLARGLPENT